MLGQTFISLTDLSDQASRQGWYELIGGSGDYSTDKPIISMRTKFVFSEWSDLFSSISYNDAVEEEEESDMPDYVAEKLVDNCYRALSATKVFTALLSFLFLLMNWQYPFLNIVLLVVCDQMFITII